MSILSGPEIAYLVEKTKRQHQEPDYPAVLPTLEIDPFDPTRIGPNSYDITLDENVLIYEKMLVRPDGEVRSFLDPREPNQTFPLVIPKGGMILHPNCLYLGSTVEFIRCQGLVPWIDGRSSIGRLGVQIHMTAGRGDDGWGGNFTLEITVVHRVRIYPQMRIGQVTFFTLQGARKPYTGRYQGDRGVVASKFWKPDTPEANSSKGDSV